MPQGNKRWLSVLRRQHLHRQRSEFHGQSHRRPAEGSHADLPGLRVQIHPPVHAPNVSSGLAAVFSNVEPCFTFSSGSRSEALVQLQMRKLLLIESDAEAQLSFRRIFTSLGLQLTIANGTEEALRSISNLKPDAVVMDMGREDTRS